MKAVMEAHGSPTRAVPPRRSRSQSRADSWSGAEVIVVRSWLSRPAAWTPEPGPRHLDLLDALLQSQPSVRLITDAHLAAIAIEHGLELCSRDRGFARWSHLGLRSRDPLA
jgi:predicted nucleic acid-binding protein